MRIRSHLVTLVLAAVLPILAFSAVMTAVFWKQQRAAFDERFLDRVRGLTIALDRELEGHIRALEILSESSALRAGDIRGFYDRAERARDRQKMWSNIILLDADSARQLMNLRLPLGIPLPVTPDKASLEAVIRSDGPYIAPLSRGPISGEDATRILVRIANGGGKAYVLVAVITPAAWLELLSKYPIAADATLTLLDQNGIVVARTLNHDRWVGKLPSPGLLENARNAPEGAYRNIGLEGQPFYSAHSRSKIAGWTLATGVPVAHVESTLWASTLAMAGGVTVTALLAVVLAFLFGRRIASPISALARSAAALPRGEASDANEKTGIEEVEEVSRAFRDAAEQLRLHEEEVRYQTQLLRTITDHAPSMLLLIDAEGRVTYANPTTEPMTGFTPEDLIGQRMHEKIHHSFPDGSPYPAAACSLTRALMIQQSVRDLEDMFVRKDGTFFDALCSASSIFRGDLTVGAVVEIQDITRRKRYEEELERRVVERTAQLEGSVKQREKLQEQLLQSQKMESLGTLAGGIAHDFNNILNIIIGYAATLARTQACDLSDGLKVIRDAAERGAALVQQLLTVAHKDAIDFAPLDVNHFLEGLVGLLRETFPKTIAISFTADPSLPRIMADANRMHQAVLNLALNARDAMPHGGVLKFATSRTAASDIRRQFHAADAEEYLSIIVSDTGAGIEAAVRERIFDPFFTTKEQGKGTGLGLTVAYGIVSSHKGFIDMQSHPGQGTTFRICLPLRRADESSEPAQPATGINNGAVTNGCETLLFVDDEERQARLMKIVLENHGYKVLVAHDGEEAVALHQIHKQEIAAVILDLGLPRLSGWEAFQRMRQEQPGLQTIFASGYIQSDIKAEMTVQGACVIHKPYLPDELLAQINAVIRKQKEMPAE
ncbi:MAG TPA: ATP-binding protein [Candidatus Binatia bacterium]|jgi:PAS domain S-box-containing protein